MFYVSRSWTAMPSGSDAENFPGSGTNVDNAGAADWANPGNITADDGSSATVTTAPAGGTDFLTGSTYGFAVTAGFGIIGVEVELQGSQSIASARTWRLALLDNTSTPIGVQKTFVRSATGDFTQLVGGPTDLWAAALTDSIVNSVNFGVRLSVDADASATDYAVDYITIRVLAGAPISPVTLIAAFVRTPRIPTLAALDGPVVVSRIIYAPLIVSLTPTSQERTYRDRRRAKNKLGAADPIVIRPAPLYYRRLGTGGW